MHIGFIEDTHFHGGTQIWVAEAVQTFIKNNQQVSLLAPEGSWIVQQCRSSDAIVTTYDWDEVIQEDLRNQEIWTNALRDWDVAICTVHPPRENFHCSVFAGRCIQEGGLETHLIPKTGTIVPEYLREFYLPDERISSSVITITDFTRRYLIDEYHIKVQIPKGFSTQIALGKKPKIDIPFQKMHPQSLEASVPLNTAKDTQFCLRLFKRWSIAPFQMLI